MSRREKPACERVGAWLRTNYGKDFTGPLSGSDWAALRAFVHLCELWAHVGNASYLLSAMASCVECMQPSTRAIAKRAIPMCLDWGHEATLWKAILDNASDRLWSSTDVVTGEPITDEELDARIEALEREESARELGEGDR